MRGADTQATARSRALRRNQSDAESRLWYHLRDRRLGGCKFRRQFPVGPYVADFACVDRRLIVELDGGQHALQVERDARRSAYLEQQGFTVLRFWNDQVLRETEAVLEEILRHLAAPHPGPLPAGGERE
jgi:very-short-patch-repair endonuclease